MIIEKAAPVINKKGMAGTSISDIMQAANLTKGGIYVNFQSKDEICLEVFNFLCRKLGAGIKNAVDQKEAAKEKLIALLDYYRDTLVQEEGGCPLMNFGAEVDDMYPEMKGVVADRLKALQNRISGLIRDGIKEGDFKTGTDPELTGLHIFSALEGAILSSRVLGGARHMKLVTDKIKADLEGMSV